MVKTGPAIRRPRYGRRMAPVAVLSAFLTLALIVLVAPAAAVAKTAASSPCGRSRSARRAIPRWPSSRSPTPIYHSCDDAPDAGPPAVRRSAASTTAYGIGAARDHRQAVGGVPEHRRPQRPRPARPLRRDRELGRVAEVRPDQLLADGRRRPATTRSPIPEWADKPYGFANFLRAARFVNSLYNGELLSKETSADGGFDSSPTRCGSRPQDRARHVRPAPAASAPARPASQRRGLRRPEPGRVDQGRLLRPARRRHLLLLEVPDQRRASSATATRRPRARRPSTRRPATSPTRRPSRWPPTTPRACRRPTWCPAAVQPQSDCSSVNPFGIDPTTYAEPLPGQPRHRRPGRDHLAVGDPRPGRQRGRVDRHDHPAARRQRRPRRVWRRLHGGISNAPAYQIWLSAVGLQPQDNMFYDHTYPWLGFRIGVVGNLKPRH